MYSNLWQVPFVIKIINIIHFIQFCHWSVGVSVCVCTLKRIHSTILNQCMGSNSSHVVIILGFDLCWFRWHFGSLFILKSSCIKKMQKTKNPHSFWQASHNAWIKKKKREIWIYLLSIITQTHQLNPFWGAGVSQLEVSLLLMCLIVFLCKQTKGLAQARGHGHIQSCSTCHLAQRCNTHQLG